MQNDGSDLDRVPQEVRLMATRWNRKC